MDPTYELISEQILTSDQSSVTFSNIPQDYDDLHLVWSARTTRSGQQRDESLIRVNGSASTIYSARALYGQGSSAASSSTSGANHWRFINNNASASISNTFSNVSLYIPNYSSNTVNKSASAESVYENNTTEAWIFAVAFLWESTNPITSIFIYPEIGPNFSASSSFYLYGIKNADDGGRGFFGPAMIGGDEVYTTGNGYKVHVFRNSGTLNVTAPGEVEYLVVGGGGGGVVGGGGAGGYRSSVGGESSGGGSSVETKLLLNPGTYSVIVGGGGVGAGHAATSQTSGSNSSLYNITSIGGRIHLLFLLERWRYWRIRRWWV